MDKEQELKYDGQAVEKNNYIWLAALLIGAILILMLLVIAGILLCKFLKKSNTADQNWAGPSPLAEGNNYDNGNFQMNECILGKMQLPSLTPNPILPNESQTSNDEDLDKDTTERKATGSAESNPLSQSSYKCLPENKSNKENIQTPPPQICQELPPPPPFDDFLPDLEQPSQFFPPPFSPSNEDDTLLTFNQSSCSISEINLNNNIFDDQPLPPPPPDYL